MPRLRKVSLVEATALEQPTLSVRPSRAGVRRYMGRPYTDALQRDIAHHKRSILMVPKPISILRSNGQ
jgi:hypothetical protein